MTWFSLLEAGDDEGPDLSTPRTKSQWPRTSSHKVLTSQQYGFYLTRLGSAAGFKDRLAYYCNRRHTANALIEGAPVAIWEQALRHQHGSHVIQEYLNRRTNFGIQALVRDRSARRGLLKLFSHMISYSSD